MPLRRRGPTGTNVPRDLSVPWPLAIQEVAMKWAEISIILGLILLNGFFAGSELALVSARKVRLKALADRGNRGAQVALQLLGDPTRLLSAVQIGITFVG